MDAATVAGMTGHQIETMLEKDFYDRLRAGQVVDSRETRTDFYFSWLVKVDPTGYEDPWIKKMTLESLTSMCEEMGALAAAMLVKQAAIRATRPEE